MFSISSQVSPGESELLEAGPDLQPAQVGGPTLNHPRFVTNERTSRKREIKTRVLTPSTHPFPATSLLSTLQRPLMAAPAPCWDSRRRGATAQLSHSVTAGVTVAAGNGPRWTVASQESANRYTQGCHVAKRTHTTPMVNFRSSKMIAQNQEVTLDPTHSDTVSGFHFILFPM